MAATHPPLSFFSDPGLLEGEHMHAIVYYGVHTILPWLNMIYLIPL